MQVLFLQGMSVDYCFVPALQFESTACLSRPGDANTAAEGERINSLLFNTSLPTGMESTGPLVLSVKQSKALGLFDL